MDGTPGNSETSRRYRLIGPIAGMTLGAVILLVLLTTFLITNFDWTASVREKHMVEQGFQRQLDQFEEILVPQSDWDDAISKLDHSFDVKFADTNFGSQLYTFGGFTRTFFVDGNGRLIYASVRGKHAGADSFAPFSRIAAQLLVPVRAAEARRAPIRPNRGQTVTRPIQATGMARVGRHVFIVIATLIQPDLGKVLPKGPQAPVAITVKPIDRGMLDAFAARYLVDDLELVDSSHSHPGKAHFRLRSPSGDEIAALAWTPRRPGNILFGQLKWPMLFALALLALVGWGLIRRTRILVDELILSEGNARHLAYHDQLTGVPSRAMLFERLPDLLAAIGDHAPLLAVLCVDLDRFKEVNDSLGHDAGDSLLKALAERLQQASTEFPDALIARLGGDEFVLICSVADTASAERLARRCIDTIMQPMDCAYGRIDVGCSIGVALIDDCTADASVVLRRADMALYEAKAQGRGRVIFFEPEMDEAFRTRRAMEDSLRLALRTDGFDVVYQPQLDAAGEVHSVEALLRWNHPELGDVSPAVFIPLAEETGLINAIGERVMRRVFAETAGWRHMRVAINVSAIQMRTQGYAAQVMRLAAQAGVDPARYEIELTETALLGEGAAIAENFDILRRLGFSIVLDDFGTGYSSLSLLHRFRVDKIKIDRSFVSGLGGSEEVLALVGAIVKLARSFRLGVIAEGVETEAQRQLLLECGCTEFQGFLLGRPVPAEQLAARYLPPATLRRLA